MYKILKCTKPINSFNYNTYNEYMDSMKKTSIDHADNYRRYVEDKTQIQRFTAHAAGHNLIVNNNRDSNDEKIVMGINDDNAENIYGWNLDEYGPMSIVKGFSSIKINSDYKLIGYKYTDGANGNGIVWAISKGIKVPKPQECEIVKENFLSPPKPQEALEDFMEAIEGDKSPLSYLQAAILKHELNEYGATWHGISWGHDIILPLSEEKKSFIEDKHQYIWEMVEDEPSIIEPHFYYNKDGEPVIVFYTINDIGIVTFNEYKHVFHKENYIMGIQKKIIATAGHGIIF